MNVLVNDFCRCFRDDEWWNVKSFQAQESNLKPAIFEFLHEIRKRKTNWIGHILRRNCLVKQIIEGKIKGQREVTRRWGRRCKKLLDDLKDRRGYCQLKEEALDRTMWRNRFRRGFGPVVWQITDDDDESLSRITRLERLSSIMYSAKIASCVHSV